MVGWENRVSGRVIRVFAASPALIEPVGALYVLMVRMDWPVEEETWSNSRSERAVGSLMFGRSCDAWIPASFRT
jgi:hypothetical protein